MSLGYSSIIHFTEAAVAQRALVLISSEAIPFRCDLPAKLYAEHSRRLTWLPLRESALT